MGGTPTLPIPGQPAPLAPGEFASLSIPQITTFALKGITPPSPLYLMRDDTLFVQATSTIANAQINLNGRLLLAARGEIIPLQALLVLPTAGTAVSFNFTLAEGYLISLSFSGFNTGFMPGQIHVRAAIARGGTSTQFLSNMLVSGYLTLKEAASWPYGMVRLPVEGPGAIRSITGTTPAVTTDITETVPTQRRWRLLSVRASLTTSATVGNRNVNFVLDDGVNAYYRVSDTLAQTAGQTLAYTFSSSGVLQQVAAFEQNLPMPPLTVLEDGHRIRTVTAGILAGDQWTAPQYQVEEWISG